MALLSSFDRAVLDALPLAAVVVDHHGVIRLVNAEWRRSARAHGACPILEEGVGQSYVGVCKDAHGPSSEGAEACWQALTTLSAQPGRSADVDYPFEAPLGRRVFRARITGLPDGVGVLVTHLEVGLARSDASLPALRGSDLGQVCEAAPIGIIALDGNGMLRYANPRSVSILGRSPEALQDERWRGAFHPEDVSLFEQRFPGRSGEGEWSVEARVPGPEGLRWVCLRAAPRSSRPGEPAGFVATLEDVTTRKQQADEQALSLARESWERMSAQRQNHAKDEFLAVLAHELRNPLAPLLAAAALLRQSLPSKPPTQRALEAIERNVQLQGRMINDLLDLSRIVHGKLELHCAPVCLAAIVRSALETQQAEAERAQVRVEVDLAEDLWVFGDADRLQQVVMNLLSNALKFTPKGGRVLVRTVRADECARILVEDTGAGLSDDEIGGIFDMFRQGRSGSKRGGLGVGLALVKAIVEQHHGTPRAESPGPGKGSRFSVDLPMIPPPEAVRSSSSGQARS